MSELNSLAVARWRRGLWGASLILLGLVGVLWIGLDSIEDRGGYSSLGPGFVPRLVMVCALLLAIAHGVTALRKEPSNPDDMPDGAVADWSGALWIALGAAVSIALIEWAGFVIACTLLFALVARAFVSPRWTTDLVLGLVLSLTVYLCFTKGLNVQLPAGVLKALGL